MESVQATVEVQVKQKGRLLRILGVSFGIASTIGGTIGVGILRTPGLVATQLGSAKLIIAAWVCGGIYALLGVNSVAELGASLPQAGGWYVYARRAFGNYAGFTVGWMDWLGNCASLAWVAITIGEYATGLVPALSGRVKLIAIATLSVFALIHLMGVRIGSRSQQAFSLIKACAFLTLVIACFVFGGKTSAAASAPPAIHSSLSATAMFVALVFALQAIITTYDGWYGSIYFAEEFANPARDIPRSMFCAILAIASIYILVNLALVYVLPISQMAKSALPAADAAQLIFGARSGQLITALALISMLGLINAVTMGGPRILFGLSRDYSLSAKATWVNQGGTPVVALLLCTVAALMLVVSGTFEIILSLMAFIYVAMYATGFAALFVLRKREPELPRPYKSWGYPWTTLIVLFGSVIFLVGVFHSDTRNSVYAVMLIAISYPVYLLVQKFGRRSVS